MTVLLTVSALTVALRNSFFFGKYPSALQVWLAGKRPSAAHTKLENTVFASADFKRVPSRYRATKPICVCKKQAKNVSLSSRTLFVLSRRCTLA